MREPDEQELLNAARNLLDGTWEVSGKEIDTEIDRVQQFTIRENGKVLAKEQGPFNTVLLLAIIEAR